MFCGEERRVREPQREVNDKRKKKQYKNLENGFVQLYYAAASRFFYGSLLELTEVTI